MQEFMLFFLIALLGFVGGFIAGIFFMVRAVDMDDNTAYPPDEEAEL